MTYSGCNITVEPAQAAAASKALVAEVQPLSLKPQLDKCIAYSPQPYLGRAAVAELDITHVEHVAVFTGTPHWLPGV